MGILWKVTLEKNIDPQFDNIADSIGLQDKFSTNFVILQNAQKQGAKMTYKRLTFLQYMIK